MIHDSTKFGTTPKIHIQEKMLLSQFIHYGSLLCVDECCVSLVYNHLVINIKHCAFDKLQTVKKVTVLSSHPSILRVSKPVSCPTKETCFILVGKGRCKGENMIIIQSLPPRVVSILLRKVKKMGILLEREVKGKLHCYC